MFPHKQYAIAHGQMSVQKLSDSMSEFLREILIY